MIKRLTDWLANWCLWTYLRLKPRREARVVAKTYAVAMPSEDAKEGSPFVIDPVEGKKVLAPEGCSWHMAIRPNDGAACLALSFDDPAFRGVVVFGEVGVMRPAEPQEAK